MKTQFGTNVKQLREKRGMDQKELGEIVGVSDKTVSSWEINRTEPKMGIVQQLADYFGVSTDYLIKGNHDDAIYRNVNIDYTRVPLYDSICCGNGGFVDDNIIDMIPVPSKGLSKSAKYFAQYASGVSMKDAGISDGDLLIFEKVNKVDDGVIGCFCTDTNTATCKKYKELNGIIMLQPMNADFDPIVVDPLSNNIRCLGKLKKVIKDFNWED